MITTQMFIYTKEPIGLPALVYTSVVLTTVPGNLIYAAVGVRSESSRRGRGRDGGRERGEEV